MRKSKLRKAWMRVPAHWGPFWIHGRHVRLLHGADVVYESERMPYWTSLNFDLSEKFVKGNAREDGYVIEFRDEVRGCYFDD